MSNKINVAIVGVGNCASALVQGVDFYRNEDGRFGDGIPGVMFADIGGYLPRDINFVAAFDVDSRKVGTPLIDAIFAAPNCCYEFHKNFSPDFSSPIVQQAPELDGVARHMLAYPESQAFRPVRPAIDSFESWNREQAITDTAEYLSKLGTDVLLNYLPVGSQKATEFWAEVCLKAKIILVNCIPVFIASDERWANRFAEAGIPIIGDDMRSQFGASIVSAVLQELLFKRGHEVQMHYQDNVGGNTDFLNMQDQNRLKSKKISKENVVKKQNHLAGKAVENDTIAAGPAAYFKALGDNKRAHWLIKATGFGGAPVEFTADLSVQDSPNSAGVVIDAIRLGVVARELGIVGPILGASAFTQKTPPIDMRPNEAFEECKALANRKIPHAQATLGKFAKKVAA
jgi:myo-inositol-1-phosphate synthase